MRVNEVQLKITEVEALEAIAGGDFFSPKATLKALPSGCQWSPTAHREKSHWNGSGSYRLKKPQDAPCSSAFRPVQGFH